MHTLHCTARNVALCPECGEPFPRAALEEHRAEEHLGAACDRCGRQVAPAARMEGHRDGSCPERRRPCDFCKLDHPARELEDHEGYCGSRTERCEDCGDFVMLRDWERHQQMALYHGKSKK